MLRWWKRLLPEPAPPESKVVWREYEEVADRVIEITATNNSVAAVSLTADTEFCDLDDSVGNLEIVLECEEVFDVEIPDEDAQRLVSIGQLTDFIARKLNVALPHAEALHDEAPHDEAL